VLNGHNIRSDLPSEHVKPERAQRMLERAQFGIYQPLTSECAAELIGTLKLIEADVVGYLESRPDQPANFKAQANLGVTYLEQRDVRKALKHRDIDVSGVQKVIHKVVDRNYKGTPEVEVPLFGFGWYGANERKLAAHINSFTMDVSEEASNQGYTSEAPDKLTEEANAIEQILRGVGASALADSVRVPGHVSLLSYRSRAPLGVQEEHKRRINDITYNHFSESDIDSVELGELVVGSDYNKQLELAA